MPAAVPSRAYQFRVASRAASLTRRKQLPWDKQIEIAFYRSLRWMMQSLDAAKASTAALAPWAALALMVGLAAGYTWRATLP